MKAKTRGKRSSRKPAGHKLWRKVLRHKYGHQWREFAKLD